MIKKESFECGRICINPKFSYIQAHKKILFITGIIFFIFLFASFFSYLLSSGNKCVFFKLSKILRFFEQIFCFKMKNQNCYFSLNIFRVNLLLRNAHFTFPKNNLIFLSICTHKNKILKIFHDTKKKLKLEF